MTIIFSLTSTDVLKFIVASAGKKLNGRSVAHGDQIFGWANIIYFAARPADD
jgi:hypothetical protein